MRVRIEQDQGVARVTLARPEKRNALDLEQFRAIVDAALQVGGDPAVRVVVVSGEGPAFCAGLDWPSFLQAGAAGQAALLDRDPAVSPANLAQRAAWVWREIPQPVIAAIHGACLGGGMQLALAADLRVAAPDTKLALREIAYGIVPDMSATVTLRRLVRADVARELVYTGRDVGADEALRLGLVTEVAADPLARALQIAAQIAERSPDAIRAAKAMLDRADDLDVAHALALETASQVPLLGSPNQIEAVMATMGRRPPSFRDPGGA